MNLAVRLSASVVDPNEMSLFCFIDVETSCSTGDALLIVASFQEPFYGLLYADGYAKVPSCRASGSGSRLLRLALNASECGINYTQSDVISPLFDSSRDNYFLIIVFHFLDLNRNNFIEER